MMINFKVFKFKDFENFLHDKKVIVNCPTMQCSEEFLQYCNAQGIAWSDGESLLTEFNMHRYFEKTCYLYNSDENGMQYGNINSYSNKYKKYIFNGLKDFLS